MFILSVTLIVVLLGIGACQKICTEQVCRLNDTSLKFFLIGDWGGLPIWPYVTPAQKAVSKTMEKVGRAEGSHFQMALGDNFYTIGVRNVEDQRFKQTFESVYNYARWKPWYILAGNHDHYGNASAEIAYSAISNRWVFPDYYYSVRYQLKDGVKVDIFVIDTVQLCGNTGEGTYDSFLKYAVWGRSMDPQGPEDSVKADQQWHWLERNLAKSKADYVFVAGHYPVWSIAEHGPTACLVQRLRPLLIRYRVNAYLSGHDHNLQHLNETDSSSGWRVDYVISGAAAYEDNSNKHKKQVPAGSSRFFYPTSKWEDLIGQIGLGNGGFVFVKVTREFAWFRYALSDYSEVHSFKSLPRNRK